jgi:hypothetical protein
LVRRQAVDLLERIGPRSVDLLEQWAVDLLLERPSTTTPPPSQQAPIDDDPPSTTIPCSRSAPLSSLSPLSLSCKNYEQID